MLIRELMTTSPVTIPINYTVSQAVKVIINSGVSDLMVVNEKNFFVGVLSENNLIHPLLPNLNEVLELGGSLMDAIKFFKAKGTEYINYPIEPLVNKNPTIIKPLEDVFYAAKILLEKQIRCLPVIDNDHLVGIFCKTDVFKEVIHEEKIV